MPGNSLPKGPSATTLDLLIRAEGVFQHALSHITVESPVDRMVSIHGLDNTVEFLYRIIADHLDIEAQSGKSLNTSELGALASEVTKFVRDEFGVTLPYLSEVKLLRQVRNLVQHGAVDPSGDIDRFVTVVRRLFRLILERVFGLDPNNLRKSALVNDPGIQRHLTNSEMAIDQRRFLEAVVAARDAFEEAYLQRVRHSPVRMSAIPVLLEAHVHSDELVRFYETLTSEVEWGHIGIDPVQRRRYLELIQMLPDQYRAVGRHSTPRNWGKDDAEFCYNFAVEAVLRWQAESRVRRVVPQTEGGSISPVWRYTIDQVPVPASFYLGPWEPPLGTPVSEVYYADRREMEFLVDLAPGSRHERCEEVYEDEQLSFRALSRFKVLNVMSRLMTNTPPRWQVSIRYEPVPLATRWTYYENGQVVQDTPCLNTATVEELRSVNYSEITEELAKAIVSYRTRVGPIMNTEDLEKVPGITSTQVDWLARSSRIMP